MGPALTSYNLRDTCAENDSRDHVTPLRTLVDFLHVSCIDWPRWNDNFCWPTPGLSSAFVQPHCVSPVVINKVHLCCEIG